LHPRFGKLFCQYCPASRRAIFLRREWGDDTDFRFYFSLKINGHERRLKSPGKFRYGNS